MSVPDEHNEMCKRRQQHGQTGLQIVYPETIFLSDYPLKVLGLNANECFWCGRVTPHLRTAEGECRQVVMPQIRLRTLLLPLSFAIKELPICNQIAAIR